MRFKNRFLASVAELHLVAALLLSAGCQSGSEAPFAYPPTRGADELVLYCDAGYDWQNVHLVVDRPVDRRANQLDYEWYGLFSFLPLIPWVRCDNNYWNSSTVNMTVFGDAIAWHLQEAGVAKTSTGRLAEGDFSLKVTLTDGGTESRETMYCLGIFPGCYVAILGAPFMYSTTRMTLQFELFSPTDECVFKESYSDDVFFLSGEYYNLNPNTFVSVCLAKVLSQAAPDISAAIERNL